MESIRHPPSAIRHRSSGVAIVGTGIGIPPRRVSNDDLSKFVDTNDEWIVQRTGIRTRYLADKDIKTSDLAADATRQALAAAGLKPTDLNLLICATMTPDVICPATACKVVEKIGAIPCGAFDINIACTGFVAGLNMACGLIATGAYKTIAVLGADTLSRIVNWKDRRTCVLFGDAASCAILQACDDPNRGSLYQHMGSDAHEGKALYVPRDQSDIPDIIDTSTADNPGWNGQFNTLQMDGRTVYKFAVKVLAESVEKAMAARNLTADDIKMVIPHQSNIRMLQSSWKRLGFPDEKIRINIDRYGNTSAASAGICLHECISEGLIQRGDYVIFVAQGGGLSWGANLWRL
ncbi:MAG: ketoacyl-ACP synthase III [Phycisphaeraceae bacterium]|nr:ketoacyl-ACP synthase III [Phycisphaeraceae bacterium]